MPSMPATIKRRIVLTACIAIVGISSVSDAYAYKVEKICEETVTKNGTRQTCKTVRVKDSVDSKNDAAKDKKGSAKSDAGPPPKH
jgi:hypothetical protein